MGFGVWYDGDDACLIDSENERLPLMEAKERVRHALKDKDKDEILSMLIDRMDVEDLMRYLADGNEKFRPELAEKAWAEAQKTALSGEELAKLAQTMPKPTTPWVDHPDDVRPGKDGSELDIDYNG